MQALLTKMKTIDHNEPRRLDMLNRFFELVRVDGSNDRLREGDTVMDLAGGTGVRCIRWAE
jgi:ubiquinone/menaquinone biosynthesis C-methylase UbiE